MNPELTLAPKKQPWKAFESKFGSSGGRHITYENTKGKKLQIPGTAGELSLSIEYDTGNVQTQ